MSVLAVGILCAALAPQDQAPAPVAPVAPPMPEWMAVLQRLKFYGDFRLRYERDFNLVGTDDSSRDRERVRLRLGVNYEISEEVFVGTRLVTGDRDDPNSSTVTLGDGFDDFEINLDRAYVTYRPDWLPDSYATGGKFANPFYRPPIYPDLTWDNDIQPEGAIASYQTHGVLGLEDAAATVGAYVIQENRDADDVNMLVGELRGNFDVGTDGVGTLATSYMYYGDLDGNQGLVDENNGNAVVDTTGDGNPDAYVSEFGLWHTVLGVNYTGFREPLVLGAQYIKNTRARIDRDQGWSVGAAWGTAANKGDWRAFYQWQVIEQDALFSSFAQDDFLIGSNFRGHVFGVNHQFTDRIGLQIWAFVTSIDHTGNTPTTSSDDDQWRVRVDLNVKL